MNTSDSSTKKFCSLNEVKNLINETTCCKNSEKPTCIDLILTNQPTLFQHSTVLETGLSYFHLLKITSPVLLIIRTTKTLTMMSLDLNSKLLFCR